MRNLFTILGVKLCVGCVALLLATDPVGAKPDKAAKTGNVTILSAIADLNAQTLTINGFDLHNGGAGLTVTLGATPLAVSQIDISGTQIIADLPVVISGTFILTVDNEFGSDQISITFGAQGAEGPAGPSGLEVLAGQACDPGESVIGFDESGIICGDTVLAQCGDGVVEGTEECDDANLLAEDGCSAACIVETDYTCIGSPSVCTLETVPILAGDLVITEIMNNPNIVTDADGEWFEIHNPTLNDLDLFGIVVTDDGADSFTVNSSLVVSAGSFVVFGRNSDSLANGGVTVDFTYTGMSLGNADDEIQINLNGTVVDRVAYDGGISFPDPDGASMNLDSESLDAGSNDSGSNWCASSTPFGDGDTGTPGALNEACP